MVFDDKTREIFLFVTDENQRLIEPLRTASNKVFFLLLLGYFRAGNRFYTPDKFYEKDIQYICDQLKIYRAAVSFSSYSRVTYRRFKRQLLEYTGCFSFDDKARKMMIEETRDVMPNQMKPRLIFLHLTEVLKSKRIELPGYHRLANIIIKQGHYHKAEQELLLKKKLRESDILLLKKLLEKLTNGENTGKNKAYNRYKITLLKKFYQSTKLMNIRANIKDLTELKGYYTQLSGVLKLVDFAPGTIRFYAEAVIRYRVYQVDRRRPYDGYVHLLCFVAHQFYSLQDIMVDTLICVMRSVNTSVVRKHKERYYEQRKERTKVMSQAIKMAKEGYEDNLFSKNKVRQIIKSTVLTDQQKVKSIGEMFDSQGSGQAHIEAQLLRLEGLSQKTFNTESTYDFLKKEAAPVQRKLNPIIQLLEFDKVNSDKDLILAIQYFKLKQGNIGAKAPEQFLTAEQRNKIFAKDGKFQVSLYKMLLFKHIFNGIKAGSLNLADSYKYRAFGDYLIPGEIWKTQQKQLLERASLTAVSNLEDVLAFSRQQLAAAYKQTNDHIEKKTNTHIRFRENGSYSLSTPKVNQPERDKLAVFFPRSKYVPLLEVLATIDNVTGFSTCFQPWKIQHEKTRPDRRLFLASIIGYGCNIGIHKMEKISRNIPGAKLSNVVNWYFGQDNIEDANSCIINFMHGMELPGIYKKNDKELHTSSDGQKFSVAVESLLASHSFKYLGKEKGVSVYSFIDQRHLSFYSTVISVADRESTFTIDGLCHNPNIESTMHSTDTHGQSEAAFALAYLLGFKLAPRIKKISNCRLYSFGQRATYIKKGYKILPSGYINTDLIEKHWNEILRFVVTVKLKICPPSQLFKRLNSYSRQHPLYQALKELGHLVRTLYILEFIDDLELRQAIEKQLNKIENSNKFTKAICVGEQEFLQATKQEMDAVDACRRLIKNALTCWSWNYLYLSHKIKMEKQPEQKQKILAAIQAGSILTWKHFNLEGLYDFSDDQMKDSFNLTNLKSINLDAIRSPNKY